MGTTGVGRRVAVTAAKGGGGLVAVGASAVGVLAAEAKLARRSIGSLDDVTPDATGYYGGGRPGPLIKLALLGDSSAVGYGVPVVEETPGSVLATGLSDGADRHVFLHSLAVVGAQSKDLAAQVDLALPGEPHVAVILVGANDVTHNVPVRRAARLLKEQVARLKQAGVRVVVGTCPDLGTVRPIAPPLKQYARLQSRRLAKAQTIATLECGARSVSLASILGAEFDAAPTVFFGPDRFHPSAHGYAALAGALLPSVMAALGLAPEEEAEREPERGETTMTLLDAVSEAARTPGTEINRFETVGSDAGAARRWDLGGRVVALRHRRRRPQTEGEAPERGPEPAESELPAG